MKKVKESEAQFCQMTELMPIKISNKGPENRVNYFNKSWLEYTEMSIEELKGRGYHKTIHPNELEEFKESLGLNLDFSFTISIFILSPCIAWGTGLA